MPKTAVGLFMNPALMEDVVREMEGLGFPRLEVRTLAEPASFGLAGVMSFPRLDFEVLLKRELARIGASESEVQAYVRGVEKGGALVLATGPDRNVEAAVQVMNDHGAVGIEQSSGPEPELPEIPLENMTPNRDTAVLAGRIREQGSGAHLFVW